MNITREREREIFYSFHEKSKNVKRKFCRCTILEILFNTPNIPYRVKDCKKCTLLIIDVCNRDANHGKMIFLSQFFIPDEVISLSLSLSLSLFICYDIFICCHVVYIYIFSRHIELFKISRNI